MTHLESNLFDLIHPSPPTLQELSSITISLQLFRCDLSKHRLNGTLDKFCEPLYLNEFLPDLPTAIETVIIKHTEILLSSIFSWENEHYEIIFRWGHDFGRNRILEVFDDFVCDFDGDIHYTKTAKRMMLSDEFTKMEKFLIACYNCFEDDIRLLWPSVSEKINDTRPNFQDELQYWICHMKNKMDEFYATENRSKVLDPIEWILTKRRTTMGSAEYFWNRTSSEDRARHIFEFSKNNTELFARFYLPKLNNHQLGEFFAQRCDFLIIFLLGIVCSRKISYVVPTFMYIKDRISKFSFRRIIIHFLKKDAGHKEFLTNYEYENRSYVYCEVWNNAPRNLKSPTIDYIFSSTDPYFEKNGFTLIFLKRLLLDATFEQRNVFWNKHWCGLVTTARCEDSYEIMKLCFSNEVEIAQFIENTMANCGDMHQYCIRFMRDCNFKILDDFLKFWFPEVRLRRELKQRLLQSFVFERNLIPWHAKFHAVEELDSFINDAFDSTELANDFKKQVILSPNLISALISSIPEYRFAYLMKFIDLFENESTHRVIAQIKTELVDALKIVLKSHTFWKTKRDGLNEFLAWCLGSEDRVAEFKRSLPADEILLACRSVDSSESLDDLANENSRQATEFFLGNSNTLNDSNELGEESLSRSEISSVGWVDEQRNDRKGFDHFK